MNKSCKISGGMEERRRGHKETFQDRGLNLFFSRQNMKHNFLNVLSVLLYDCKSEIADSFYIANDFFIIPEKSKGDE